MNPRFLQWSDLKEGMSVVSNFSVDENKMKAFAQLSGDHNPIHLDEKFARSKGMDGCVVYAGLFWAELSRIIGMELPGRDSLWISSKMNFKQPLYVGKAAKFSAVVDQLSESTGLVSLNISVSDSRGVIASGKAEVVVK